MFKPNLYKLGITDIKPGELKMLGVNTLFLDVDNTLSTHHGFELASGLLEWIDEMKKEGINLILVSNSKRSRVEPFANSINLPFVSLSLKPLAKGFNEAKKRLGEKKKNICVVGDQLFTDVLGAKLYGVKVILLKPILLEDKLGFKVKRYLEKIIFKIEKIG